MKLGLSIAATNWEGGAPRLGPTLVEIVEAAEAAGFDVISVTDHVGGSKYNGGGEQGDGRPFHGKHVRMERPLNVPQGLSRPHPPILIAGGGERKTLPLVARYADACNVPPGPELPRKLELLKRLCEQEGRDYGAIEKTVPFFFDVGENGSKVGELIGQLRGLAGMGA